mmetsp:Transcript_8658/g.22252  ORF Transcript_8658/g.22252 Transcript_8658/m.22252 type:complete len:477 (+) Transcript_8658:87-1517(+)
MLFYIAARAVEASVVHNLWTYFGQSFYHAAIIPLLALTVVLAWYARPSTSEEMPRKFANFQYTYLVVWCVCVAADWLQGPYVYALYSAYGFTGQEIAQLFVAGFASSLVFGCFVGSLADRFGRKLCCMAYCAFYIASCITKHWQHYWILMLGRVLGGVATSLIFSCFECWMVSEHLQRFRFSSGLLSYMFGLMFTFMYFVAIASGLAAQLAADSFTFAPVVEGSLIHTGGYCVPFDLAIICLVVGAVLIALLWEENYGSEECKDGHCGLFTNISESVRMLAADAGALRVCVIVAAFEGTMYAFVFNWTPALESKTMPLPHGVVFSLFMMACMSGASASTLVSRMAKPTMRLAVVCGIGILVFGICAFTAGGASPIPCFLAFLAFEFCVGVYFPTIGIVKSEIVPEHVRGTMYNLYRVPLNAVVVCLLLTDISMVVSFQLCACLLTVALVAVFSISMQNHPLKLGLGGLDLECPKQS